MADDYVGKLLFPVAPRHFGKLLLANMLEEFFAGQKDLFEGLYVYNQEWESYSIMHLDLNAEKYNTQEALLGVLNNYLCLYEVQYGTENYETHSAAALLA